jgi:hypothetical protein
MGRERRRAQFTHKSAATLVGRRKVPGRIRRACRIRPEFRRLALPHPNRRANRFGAHVPGYHHRPGSFRRAVGHWPVRRPSRRNLHEVARRHPRVGRMPQRRRKTRRTRHANQRVPLAQTIGTAHSFELAEATSAYYLHTIEAFGPARCMFESNFPVDRQSCSYTVLWNSFERIAASFSDDEKASLFHDTAARVYRLDGSA